MTGPGAPYAITAYASYLPRGRLAAADIPVALRAGRADQRTVAWHDEDPVTMAVAAARASGNSADIRQLVFATTEPPYADKLNASIIHAAMGLDQFCPAIDMTGALRSGAQALSMAIGSGGLVAMADIRVGLPGADEAIDSSDGAAAFLFGSADAAPVATPLAVASATAEVLDRWRAPGDLTASVWDDRFSLAYTLPLVERTASRALGEAGINRADHVRVSAPSSRLAAAVARRFDNRDRSPAQRLSDSAAPRRPGCCLPMPWTRPKRAKL